MRVMSFYIFFVLETLTHTKICTSATHRQIQSPVLCKEGRSSPIDDGSTRTIPSDRSDQQGQLYIWDRGITGEMYLLDCAVFLEWRRFGGRETKDRMMFVLTNQGLTTSFVPLHRLRYSEHLIRECSQPVSQLLRTRQLSITNRLRR